MPTRRTLAANAGRAGVTASAVQAPRKVLRVSFIIELDAWARGLRAHYRTAGFLLLAPGRKCVRSSIHAASGHIAFGDTDGID